MILYKIFYNKHEVNYFMKLLIFLSMIITSSTAAKGHSSQKSPLRSTSNETLSDQDFEDSLNSNVLSEHSFSIPNLLEKIPLIEKEVKFQSSTHYDINVLKKTKIPLQHKKHRNIIKMVCDSDNLISQMTLHMNFLDNNPKDEKYHDFTFKKIFNSEDPKNEISFSYPEIPETFPAHKSDETESESSEKPVKDIESSFSKPHNENEPLKKDDDQMNYLPLNEEYENYPVSKKKNIKTQTYSKDDYKSEIKKFNSGSRIQASKSMRENYSPYLKEKKSKKKMKFWVTAMAFTETSTLQNSEDLEKNDLLHKLHLSQSSDNFDPFSLNSNTPEAEESNPDPGLENNNSIPPDIDNVEKPQNSTLSDQDNSFSDKEYDGENKNNEGVLNYSKTLKKYKLANSEHAIDENESIIQSDDTFLYDYPVSYKKQYRSKILKKDNDQLDQGKTKKKYKAWKNSLIAHPKMKSIFSSNKARISEENNSSATADKKKKILQRQKVIENLKFILSKQDGEHPKTESNVLRSKYFSLQRTKDAPKILNLSKTLNKNNSKITMDISNNQTDNVEFLKGDKETKSSRNMEEVLLAYRNKNLPFDIYDIEMNTDVKSKLKNKELFCLANDENKQYVNHKDLNTNINVPYKKDDRLTYKKTTNKQSSQGHNQLEKYLVKRMVDDKVVEEIRKGVFLKKGIPLQFNPYQNASDLDNKEILSLQIMSPFGGSQRKLGNSNKKQNSHAENDVKSTEQKNSLSDSENLKMNVRRDAMTDSTYQKACNRFLRDVALIKFLDDKYNDDSICFSI